MDKIFSKGSEWRKWDLHIHTKGTNKNDQFSASSDFNAFCVNMFRKALENNIAAIGITDYFSIDNYQKVIEFVSRIDNVNEFDDKEKQRIKDILIIPNVELRILPVTDRGRLVNIHCLFNPSYVANLENDFFGSLDYSSGSRTYKMNRRGLTDLGKSLDSKLDELAAYKRGVDNFVLSHTELQRLVKENPDFEENTIIAVSNSNNDGASAFQKHYDFFESTDPGSLEALRKSIYCLSQFVFSANNDDRKYFLGQKSDDEKKVKTKCGSLKACIHGSDAHTEEKLFSPTGGRFCWIKSDLTFEGLRQVIFEPEDRVYIGTEPPVLERVRNNKTKYINSLIIDQNNNYDGKQGKWFKNVNIDFNKELIAIIGNKGSCKSALSDIIGVIGNTHNAGIKQGNLSFLNAQKLKFRKKGYAENFNAELIWEDGSGKGINIQLNQDIDINQTEKVKYLPQNYFENLTNDLEGEGFENTLKSVIFLHLPEEQRLNARTFNELESLKTKYIETDLLNLRDEIHNISTDIIKLEAKKHPNYYKQLISLITEKQKELDVHEKNKPEEKPDPSKKSSAAIDEVKKQKYIDLQNLNIEYERIENSIIEKKTELNVHVKDYEELIQLRDGFTRLVKQLEAYKRENKEIYQKFNLNIDDIIKTNFDQQPINSKISGKFLKIESIKKILKTKGEIDSDPKLINQLDKIKEAYKISFILQQDAIQAKINDIKKLLSKPEKEFQEYKEKLNRWETKKKNIEGTATQLNTLKFFQKEKEYIDKELMNDLKNKRTERLNKALDIFRKKQEIIQLYKLFKKSIDTEIAKDDEFTKKFKMEIDVNFKLDPQLSINFLHYINKTKRGTFLGASEKDIDEIFIEKDLLSEKDISEILNKIIELLEVDQRETDKTENSREILDQIEKVQEFYDFIFSLEYLKPIYELKLDNKTLDELSPGEKGALLLVFYLMIDKEDIPLIIDQPEDNLDNKSVFQVLTHFIKSAKKRRQIIIVTHNPNLAVGADAEQIIYVELDKKDGKNIFSYYTGSIENPVINSKLVEILEGTMPAFDKRKLRYNKS